MLYMFKLWGFNLYHFPSSREASILSLPQTVEDVCKSITDVGDHISIETIQVSPCTSKEVNSLFTVGKKKEKKN